MHSYKLRRPKTPIVFNFRAIKMKVDLKKAGGLNQEQT